MIRPNFFTTADRLELLSCVKRQREDHGVARRANALLLLDDGMSCSQIAKVLFLDDDTVRSWHKQYPASYCQIWCLRFLGQAAIWPVLLVSIPSLNVTPVMTLAR